MSERSWREQHPFLYGLCSTFGIAPVSRPVDSVQQSFDRVAATIAEAVRRARENHPPVGEEAEPKNLSGEENNQP